MRDQKSLRSVNPIRRLHKRVLIGCWGYSQILLRDCSQLIFLDDAIYNLWELTASLHHLSMWEGMRTHSILRGKMTFTILIIIEYTTFKLYPCMRLLAFCRMHLIVFLTKIFETIYDARAAQYLPFLLADLQLTILNFYTTSHYS